MEKGKSKYFLLIGQKFNKLTINKIISKPKGKRDAYYAVCTCECGKEKEIPAVNVIRFRTVSCGCAKDYDQIRGKNNVNFTGFEEVSGQYFAKLKRGAKNRNLEFKITVKDVWNLYIKQSKKCALTGWDISWAKNAKLRCSVDRKDSKKGYTIDNIQIIELHVNIMKMALSQEEFIGRCKTITEYQEFKSVNKNNKR
jgi:hypothetical protein